MFEYQAGKRRAEKRHKFMEEFLEEFYDEWAGNAWNKVGPIFTYEYLLIFFCFSCITSPM